MSLSGGHQWPRGPRNALHDAASHGVVACIVSMLSSGSFDIDEGDPQGFTPLMCAAFGGHALVTRILLNKRANVFIKEDQGATALFFSVQLGYLDVTNLLVQSGSDLEARNNFGYTPLHRAAVAGHTEVARVLIQAGSNPNCRGPSGSTPLWGAALQGHKDIAMLLLRAKANPLLATKNGNGGAALPLDVAAQHGHTDVVLELIERVGIEGCGGASGGIDALCFAGKFEQVGVMAILTDAGVADTGEALCVVAESGCEGSVEFLLQEQQRKEWATSCTTSYVDAGGPFRDRKHCRTPLGCSIDACSPRVARRLLDAGADTARGVHDSIKVVSATSKDTPLAYTIRSIGELTADGRDAHEDKLHKLEAIRRLLLQVDAVHAISWLWLRDTSSAGANDAEGTTRTKMTPAAGTQLRLMLPIVRRRSRRPGVLLAALWR